MCRLMTRAVDFILQFEWILLGVIALPLLFPSPKLTPVMLTLPLLWSFHWWRTGSPFPKTVLNVPLLIFALMLLVSLYATFSIEFSLPKISGMLLGFGVFFAVVRYAASSDQWFYTLGVYLIAGLALAVLALLGGIWPTKIPLIGQIEDVIPQLVAGLPGAELGFHPNEISGALLWVLPLFWTLVFVLFLHKKQIFTKHRPTFGWLIAIVVLLIAVSTTAVLIMTQSRAGYIGLASVSPFILFPVLPKRIRWPVLILCTTLVVVLGVAFLADSFSESEDGFISETNGSGALSIRTMSGRFEIWSRAVYGIQDFAFTGMGMNTFRRVVHVLYPLFTIAPDKDIAHAHNNYLQVALDLGLPGLIAYLALLMGSLVMLFKIWQWRQNLPFHPNLTSGLSLGLGGCLVAHSTYGLLDAVALGAKPGILWWWLLGLVASLYKLSAGARVQGGVGDKEKEQQFDLEQKRLRGGCDEVGKSGCRGARGRW